MGYNRQQALLNQQNAVQNGFFCQGNRIKICSF